MSDKTGWIQFPDTVKLELHSQPAEPGVEMLGKYEQQPIILPGPVWYLCKPEADSDAGGQVATAEDRVNRLVDFSFYFLEGANKRLQAERAALEIKLADANGRIVSLEAELADLKPKPVPAPIAPIHAAIRAKPAFGGLRCIFE